MRRLGLALTLLLLATALPAQQAATPPAPVLIYVHEEVAKPSMIADYESTTKEFGAMMRGANIPFHYDVISSDDFHYYNLGDGFTIYQAIVAADLPFIVVETVGKDPADLAAQSAKNMQALGDRARTLNNRTLDVVRRFESKFGRPRPDLSNPAPKVP